MYAHVFRHVRVCVSPQPSVGGCVLQGKGVGGGDTVEIRVGGVHSLGTQGTRPLAAVENGRRTRGRAELPWGERRSLPALSKDIKSSPSSREGSPFARETSR